jgi:TfoX/Sxy family transcriptional regulator of competence genes
MSPEGSWKKSDPALVDRFHAALPDHPAAERRKMFGYPACFVNGNYFSGLYQDQVVVRLPGGMRDRFTELADAPPFDPMGTGKGMKDWYRVPAEIADDDARLADFLEAAIVEVAELPPKERKKRR